VGPSPRGAGPSTASKPCAGGADTAFVEELTVIPGNVNNGRAGGEVLPAQVTY
jgi:hypothetical protein